MQIVFETYAFKKATNDLQDKKCQLQKYTEKFQLNRLTKL